MSEPDLRGLAGELQRRGLAAPALLLLDIHRPLRPLLSDIATVVGPALRPILGTRLAAIDRALEDDEAYGRLLDQLADDDRSREAT